MRFYVTMTWDDWPEGGSYGTIIEAETHEQAEELCRQEMAEHRADAENDAAYYLNLYAHEWHTVDCWPLDEFIERHRIKPDNTAKAVAERGHMV